MAGKTWSFRIKETGAKKASKNINNLKNNMSGLSSTAKKLAVVFGVGFLGKQIFDIGKSAVNTAASFETLKVRLNVLYGSVQRGTQAFDNFNKVAAETPFQLQDVVDAGASLKAFGLDAEEMIKPLADLAAFMQVDMSVAASNMGRAFVAGAGAADMFREKGINQMIADMAGVMDATKLPIEEYRKTLQKVLIDPNSGIAGMTTKMADTWNGAVSNFQDGIDRLKAAIGDQLIAALRPKLDAINAELSKLGGIGWENVGLSLQGNFGLILEVLKISAGAGGKIIGLKLLDGIQFAIQEFAPTSASAIATAFGGLFGPIHNTVEDFLIKMKPSLDESIVQFEGYGSAIGKIMEETQLEIQAIYAKIIADAQEHKDKKEELEFQGPPLPPFIPNEEELEKLSMAEAMYNEHMAKIEEQTGKFRDMNIAEVDITRWKTEQTDKYLKQDAETRQQIAGNLAGSMGALFGEMKGFAGAEAAMRITEATINTYSAANKALATYPPPLSYAAAAATVAAGLANVGQITSSMKSFATGGSFVTSGPEAIMVGDNPSGREQVNVIPLDIDDEPTAGGAVNISISGNVMSEDYTEEVIIPQLKSALRRGEDIGIG